MAPKKVTRATTAQAKSTKAKASPKGTEVVKEKQAKKGSISKDAKVTKGKAQFKRQLALQAEVDDLIDSERTTTARKQPVKGYLMGVSCRTGQSLPFDEDLDADVVETQAKRRKDGEPCTRPMLGDAIGKCAGPADPNPPPKPIKEMFATFLATIHHTSRPERMPIVILTGALENRVVEAMELDLAMGHFSVALHVTLPGRAEKVRGQMKGQGE